MEIKMPTNVAIDDKLIEEAQIGIIARRKLLL